MDNLTPKQRRFCEEYVIDLNGTQAAIRAGYSIDSAKEIASMLLTKFNVSEYVSKLQKKLSDKTQITAEKVINELAKIGFSNVQDFIDSDNSIKDISQIDSKKAAAVSSIKKSVTTFGDGKNTGTKEVVEFKIWDKVSALEKLGKHLGLFTDRVEITGNIQQRQMKLPDGTIIDL